ncbi:MAG: DOMON domain-containing protein [Desulfotignum sp.]|nr:DOMON domain-containing protein [Desulfobacteraceae bacterium]
MIRNIGLMVLAAAVIFSGNLFAAEYAHKLETKNMSVSWTLEGEQIHLQLSAQTTGWVAIGIDPEDAMGGADIIIGAVKNGKVRIEDHYADSKRGHSPDEKLGGQNHVIHPEGSETDGVTTISFSLSASAAEQWDKPIHTDKMTRVMVAYGTGRDSFRTTHRYRAVYDINFATGETVQVK